MMAFLGGHAKQLVLQPAAMPTAAQSSFYADPAVYDILHTPGTAAELDVLQQVARRFVPLEGRPGHWLEPGCGTARYLRLLARRGETVIGFDGNQAMIAYARQRLARLGLAQRASLFVADMSSFARQIGERRIDIAFNLINTIRHLESDRAMLAHFGEIAQVLQPRGVYIVGISLSRYGKERPTTDAWAGTRGSCRVSERVSYSPPTGRERGRRARREQVRHQLLIDRPSGCERRQSSYGLRCYDQAQWRQLLGRSALEPIASLDEFGQPLAGPEIYQLELLRPR